MTELVYKILTQEQWQSAQKSGEFLGAPVDLKDGFIHFSAAHQLSETAAKHFSGMPDLVLLSVPVASLGADLKWEISRGGEPFPHLYRSLMVSEIEDVHVINLNDDDSHDLAMVL